MKKILFFLFILLVTKLHSQSIKIVEIPPTVNKAFYEKFPQGVNSKWTLRFQNNYEVSFINKGELFIATFNKNGNWISSKKEVNPEKIDSKVLYTVQAQFPDFKILQANEVQTNSGQKRYEVEIGNDKGNRQQLLLKGNGDLILNVIAGN